MAWILICPECENRFEADSSADLRQEICCPACRKFSPPEEYSVLMFCPECHTKLAIPLDMLQESELQCPKCRAVFSVDTSLSLNTDLSVETTFFADAGQVMKSKQMLEEGAFFDKFKIIRLLGKGGMGEVYLAEHLLLKRQSALKVLKNSGDDPVFIKRFIREAKLANRIQHPGLISVFDIGHDIKTDYLFIAMEYVEGFDVGGILKERTLSENDILGIALEVLEPLKVLERERIVHRDIKPSNIMITTEGKVKLADLGIAKVENSEYGEFTLTQENSVFGTPEYASPEQCRSSHNVDIRSDIYSLGATMYHLAARKPPFSGDTAMAVLLNVMQQEPVPLHELDRNISVGFSDLVQDMMRKEPSQRPGSIAELEERMRNVNSRSGKFIRAKKYAGTFFKNRKKTIRVAVELVIFALLIGIISRYVANGHMRTLLEEALKFFGGSSTSGQTAKISGPPVPRLSSDGKILKSVTNGNTLKRFKIPAGVEAVDGLYGLGNIEHLDIPSSVRILPTSWNYGTSIVSMCRGLRTITVAPDNPYFSSVDGVLFSKKGDMLITYPAGRLALNYVIPKGVKSIGSGAFAYSKYLEEVSGLENISFINSYAFYNSSIQRIVIPENVKRIEEKAFTLCRNLSSVTMKGKPYIATNAFLSTPYRGDLNNSVRTSGSTVPQSVQRKSQRREINFGVLNSSGERIQTAVNPLSVEGRLERCRAVLKTLRSANSGSQGETTWNLARIRFTEKQLTHLEKQMANRRLAIAAREKKYSNAANKEVQELFRKWTTERRDWGRNERDSQFAADLIRLLERDDVDPNVNVADATYSRYFGPMLKTLQSGRLHRREDIENVLFRRYADTQGIKFYRVSEQALLYGVDNLVLEKNLAGERLLRFLEAGADPNRMFPTGETALHWAARRNSKDDVQNLLLAGADVTLLDRQGQTPLMWAEKFNSKQVISLLLAAGCDRNHKDNDGRTAEDLQIEGAFRLAVQKEDIAKVKSLIDKVNPDNPLANEETPLTYACSKTNYQLAKLLLEHKANPNLKPQSGYLPLQLTFFYGHDDSHRSVEGLEKNLKIFSLLLEYGANPYISPRGYGGFKSLLHWMSSYNYYSDMQRTFEDKYARELAGYMKDLNPANPQDCKVIRMLKSKNIDPGIEDTEVILTNGGRTLAYCPDSVTGETYTVPAGVTKIDREAFSRNQKLRSIIIPEGVREISYSAFWGCPNLKNVKLPSTLTIIRAYAFQNCTSLESIVIPEGVTEIGVAAFKSCRSLTSVKLPDSLKKIGSSAFSDCLLLNDVRIPPDVSVASNAFPARKNSVPKTEIKKIVITGTFDIGGQFNIVGGSIRYVHTGGDMPERVFVNGVRWRKLSEPFKLNGRINVTKPSVKKHKGRGQAYIMRHDRESVSLRIWDGESGSDRYKVEVMF